MLKSLVALLLLISLAFSAPARLDSYLSSILSSPSSSSSSSSSPPTISSSSLSSPFPSPFSSTFNIFVVPHPVDESLLPLETQTRLSALRSLLLRPLSEIARPQRRQIVYEVRSTLAALAQEPLVELLRDKGFQGRSIEKFWINSSIYVFGVSRAMIRELAQHGDVVAEIRGDYPRATVGPMQLQERKEGGQKEQAQGGALEWNIAHIGADQAWNVTRGEGAVVAVIDTGVRVSHEALIGSYRGSLANGEFDHDYNWFDPHEFSRDPWWCTPGLCYPAECCMDTPFDPIGHGSHVTGSVAGSESIGIGVAPGAKWIGAKGCRDGQCLNLGLVTSAQWVLCPTRLDGSDPNCAMGADIVHNSWGGVPDDDWYMEYTTAWRDAGMIPVFSQGNSGPRCEKLGSPGDYDHVIGVGAYDSEDSLADFSSRGPASGNPGFGIYKPDISAPGVDINSAGSYVGSTNEQLYSVSSGTSMSAPHISGVIALLLSVNPNLSYDEVLDILGKTANKNVGQPDNGRQGEDVCGDRRFDNLPSFHYGEGLVNAYQAVLAAKSRK